MTDLAIENGRRRRGQDNRARIVAAMLDIIREGEMSPGAEQVAARADVGLRTVFRHFQDMESLYREIAHAIDGEVLAMAQTPFRSQDWHERIVELVERRSSVFENLAPFKRAADTIRHRSPFLESSHGRMVQGLRGILLRELPPEIAADPARLEILDLLLSFETWQRLRREQALSPDEARRSLEAAIRQLIA
jgi:AcrR family transcriptional regulator